MSNDPPPASKRRLTFGTRFLLVALTVACVGLGLFVFLDQRARTQQNAVERVRELGGKLGFANSGDDNMEWRRQTDFASQLSNAFNQRYSRAVSIVTFDDASNPTDEDLKALRPFTSLKQLFLMNRKQVSDAGLHSLSAMTQLELVALNGTRVSGAGLASLKKCSKLRGLAMNDAPLTDAGLVHIGQFPALEWLQISRSLITDDGLVHLTRLKQLETLEIRETKISDAGLTHIAQITSLQTVRLYGTNTTAEGRRQLQAKLPGCVIAK